MHVNITPQESVNMEGFNRDVLARWGNTSIGMADIPKWGHVPEHTKHSLCFYQDLRTGFSSYY